MEQIDIERLSKLCGMLGSNHDGERASTALKASQFILDRGMTWETVIRGAFLPAKAARPEPEPKRTPHWSEEPRSDAEWCRAFQKHCANFMTPWEANFVRDVLARKRWPLSERQREVIARMKAKYP